jgi:hypothetical protein
MKAKISPYSSALPLIKQLNRTFNENSKLMRGIRNVCEGEKLERILRWHAEAGLDDAEETIAENAQERDAIIRALRRALDRGERAYARVMGTGDMLVLKRDAYAPRMLLRTAQTEKDNRHEHSSKN